MNSGTLYHMFVKRENIQMHLSPLENGVSVSGKTVKLETSELMVAQAILAHMCDEIQLARAAQFPQASPATITPSAASSGLTTDTSGKPPKTLPRNYWADTIAEFQHVVSQFVDFFGHMVRDYGYKIPQIREFYKKCSWDLASHLRAGGTFAAGVQKVITSPEKHEALSRWTCLKGKASSPKVARRAVERTQPAWQPKGPGKGKSWNTTYSSNRSQAPMFDHSAGSGNRAIASSVLRARNTRSNCRPSPSTSRRHVGDSSGRPEGRTVVRGHSSSQHPTPLSPKVPLPVRAKGASCASAISSCKP